MVKLKIRNEEKVRKMIALRGESANAFAKRIGTSNSYLSRILTGTISTGPRMAKIIADGLNQDIVDIFFTKNV